jgi:SNF2 family DNA or RNA helicase
MGNSTAVDYVFGTVFKYLQQVPPLKRIVIEASSTTKDIEKLYKLCRAGTPCAVVVTYEQIRRRCSELSFPLWGLIFLDEGHRIRNPDADITVSCKKLKCPRRFILSGSPIQNSLTELWSLMDFVYPGMLRNVYVSTRGKRLLRAGKLSTLPIFKEQFVAPIRLGGFSNATPGQLHVAYACAVALRDIIMEHMLRRMKAQVKIFLPKKTDEVVLCRITPLQVRPFGFQPLIFNQSFSTVRSLNNLMKIQS